MEIRIFITWKLLENLSIHVICSTLYINVQSRNPSLTARTNISLSYSSKNHKIKEKIDIVFGI